MAVPRTQPAQAAGAQLCDHCRQKPKFGNHQYCSKTCAGQAATQAATMCNHCRKKPKFQKFDYCGKHCASLAAANGTKSVANGGTTKRGNNPGGNQKAASGTIDPMQIAQLVVQHVPQIQSLLANAQGQGSSSAFAGAQSGGNQPPVNNALLNTGSAGTQASQPTNGTRSMPLFSRMKKNAKPKLNVSTKPSDDTRCIIPGCKQPVYVDEEGIVSEYCSLRHREEAVTSGLKSPCIMCLVLPQSEADYFCSKACLEESMSKQYDDDEESGQSSTESQD